MPNEKRNLILVFSIVAVTTLGGIIFLRNALNITVDYEIAKALTQFLLVGVLGVFISLLVQNYNRQRDKDVLINDLRKTVLTDLITAYSDTKRARRIIMGNRLRGGNLPYKVYDEQIKNIITTQLALELITHRIKTFPTYFGKDVKSKVIDNVTNMEKYLGEIIDEYKDVLTEQSQIPETLKLVDLSKLNSSVSRRNEDSNFTPKFVEPYRTAVEEIRNQILI